MSQTGAISWYRPLDAKEAQFRVLLVSPGRDEDLLRVRLQRAQFCPPDHPDYVTISYCWGDANNSAWIQLDGRPIKVLASAVAALKRIRLPRNERTVWIDALCMNQEDWDERAQQIAIMDCIYCNSVGNLIFPEEAGPLNTKAIDSIDKAIGHINEIIKDLYLVKSTPDEHRKKLDRILANGRDDNIDARALGSFFDNPWFRRVWPFQEVGLTPRNTCLYGPDQVDLTSIVRLARYMKLFESLYPDILNSIRGLWCASQMWNFVDKEFGHPLTDQHAMLTSLMTTSKELLTSEPRDHVYGLLGLWNQKAGLGELPAELRPDYDEPIGHIYRNATRVAIDYSRSLEVWSLISHRHEESLDPSKLSWALALDTPYDHQQDPSTFYHDFNANDDQPLVPLLQDPTDQDIIQVFGIVIEQILEVTKPFSFEEYSVQESRIAWFSDAVTKVQSHSTYTTAYADILTRLLAMIHLQSGWTKDALVFFRLLGFLDGLKSVYIDPEIDEVQGSSAALEEELTPAMNQCLNRKAFITQSGSLGLGPKLTKSGDYVVVLYGGNAPFVLRPSSGPEWRLVGECYFKGVMGGEAMREHKHEQDGKPDVAFEIR